MIGHAYKGKTEKLAVWLGDWATDASHIWNLLKKASSRPHIWIDRLATVMEELGLVTTET
jgi:hypothetical protein